MVVEEGWWRKKMRDFKDRVDENMDGELDG